MKDRGEWRKVGRKLHLQFGHGSEEKLEKLVKDAYKGRKEYEKTIEEFRKTLKKICEECDICR